MTRPLQVFLCHASQDKPEVWKLHRYLKTRGVKPWLDQADLLPGEDWEVEIPKALFASDVILVCLSKNSVNKEGYVQKEIAFALDKALEKPEGTIFIIPVKLEDCELPKRLSRYQAVDLFRRDGRKRLLMGLNKRIANLGEEVLPLKIEETKQRTPKPIKPKIEQERSLASLSHGENKIEEKKEVAKPFKRVLNPTLLNPQKKSEPKEHKQNYNFSRLGIIGIILISILGIVFAGNYFLNNLPVSQTPEITHTEITVTSTLAPTTTATKSLAISTTTRFDIGSTTLGSDDMLLMYVPAGEFTMGNDNGHDDERPVSIVKVSAYWIDQTEVTNVMYARCVNENGCNPPDDSSSSSFTNYFGNVKFDNFPIVNVSWHNANDYCMWAGRRLPTEAEWEKAARGIDGRTYPWGNIDPKDTLLNFADNVGNTTAVGSYPAGKSIFGVLDLSGNVWEWVGSLYKPYPYNANDGRENLISPGERVIRGGSWVDDFYKTRSTYRTWDDPSHAYNGIGFRCAMDGDQ